MTSNPIPEKIARVLEQLAHNRIDGTYVETRAQVAQVVEKLLKPGDRIGLGGSVTLQECGILDLVRKPEYQLIDRYEAGLTRAQMQERFRAALTADVFLSGCNAITEKGELYNVDGNANRLAAILFGPDRVILVAGCQKIVPDVAAAVERVRTVAAPLNARRLNKETYCAKTGHCVACGKPIGAGCDSPDRICRDYAVCASQAVPGRIHVILVGEETGY